MAVLGKIRQRSILLIGVIGFCLFAFVIGDVVQNGSFGINSNNIGSVNGTDIDAQQFMQKVAQLEQQNQNTTNAQAMNNVWEQEIRNIILGEQIEKAGLGIANDQLINEIKKNPYFSQNPQFLNEAGQFDENKFREFVKSIQNDPNQDRWNEWKNFENEVAKTSIQQLYYNLIKGGVYTTQAEGKFKYVADNRKVDFEYVTVPYNTINDDEVKVSDDEIIAYMKKYPKRYKSDNTRSIEYVLFENKPSEADEKEMQSAIDKVMFGTVEFNNKTNANDTIPAFKDVVNVAEYVNNNSDIKFDSTYLAKSELPLDYQEQLFNLSKGEVFGPYSFNGHQCVSKMLDRKPNASVKASHVLISYADASRSSSTRTKEEAQTLANEILAKAKANPADFGKLAEEFSDDPGSKTKGGEYDNIMPGQMVPQFNDFIFDNAVGTIGLVETDFGFHVIKVNDKYEAVLMATIAQKVEPSEATIDANYTKASKFEKAVSSKDFAETAKADNLTATPVANLKATDEYVGALGTQRPIVLWAFNEDTNVGDVKRFDVSQGFVVAKVTNKNETGLLAIDVARESVGSILRNEKKAVKIREKMKGETLEEVAKVTGGSVILASNVTIGTSVIPNIGRETKVVGTAFNLASGKTSDLIDGTTGVYKIRTKKVTDEPQIANFKTQTSQEMLQQQNAAQMRVYQALKDKADIEDNRVK
jgi:peptidyl-prolyl cis-trans isomerase D